MILYVPWTREILIITWFETHEGRKSVLQSKDSCEIGTLTYDQVTRYFGWELVGEL